ncbi:MULTISPECIES: alpha/beta hydrolase [unclassified Lysobacter]|uniref:alpha/beta fold hydrolase n=1 Tax=unclassified Lysobacter TaxID=2635362 RepID=UPI001BE839A9|nr:MULTISPECIES: alpha/beta hydrolase [unclassified Lysobacter]MBT2744898.1 alpha/beta hydrolase [Lysobacter sp. ISL-42]MBT2752109.1 alpha/beta hydrolase [Lysobacter sp. ISL-50]MBT2778606.1 alpha/beta hydrolase [Lysobacter sp. ISL-54]MBT2780463.1 alpha/beta hydrolase [Lysobacter sp. ISL-52]
MRSIALFLLLLICGPSFGETSESGRPASVALEAPTLYVNLGRGRIAYRKIGTGPVIVLANRFRGTLDTWDPLFLDALAQRHTLVLFDYPGIGYSEGVMPESMEEMSRFLDEFTKAIGIQRFAMLGWSWGGLVAQAYFLDYPSRVSHGILIATNPAGQNAIPLQPAFLERALKPINDLPDEEVLFFEPKSERSRQLARASHDRIYTREGVTPRIPSTPEQFQRYFRVAEGFHQDPMGRRERLMETTLPVLVLSGDHDTSTAGQNWFPLIGRMRNAQFVFHSEAGHAPQHQYPEWSVQTVETFLTQAPH